MYPIYPPEIIELREKFKPYEGVGCVLSKDAPKEAVEAQEKYYKWLKETIGMEQ